MFHSWGWEVRNSIIKTYSCVRRSKYLILFYSCWMLCWLHGKKYTTMNYTKYLINQTLSATSKFKDWHWLGTWCVWIMIELLKIYIYIFIYLFNTKPDGVRRVGRPKLWWEDGVEQDMRILKVKNWKKVALDRDKWAKLLTKARTHQGLSS